jgi:3-hydroxyacyl-CoA dehydrogenase
MTINSVAVLGAGTMGSQIALHCANAGFPVHLLDLTAEQAQAGLKRARALSPDPQFTDDVHRLVTAGGFDAHLARITEADWILEAIIEQPEAKRALLARVDELRRPDAIVSSNTSGIPITALAEGRSDGFRSRWLGTHFFNPPRYLRLLELVPTVHTDPAVVNAMARFGDRLLGKGVVVAKDTPGFIGNHIGVYGLMRVLRALEGGQYTIEEIDAITGTVIGRPASATFRTLDIAGIDVLAAVMRNLHQRLPDPVDREAFVMPAIIEALVTRGRLGEKTGYGFYKRERKPDGQSEILTLDPSTLEYRPRQAVRFPSIDAVKATDDVGERVRTLFAGQDRVGQFLRETLAPALIYAAHATPTIAHTTDDVDRVMRWGYGWELGPFELMDAIGVEEVMQAAEAVRWRPGPLRPTLVAEALRSNRHRFREAPLPPAAPDLLILRSARDRQQIVRKNAGASLVDLGDGVLCVEFHSKMNAIGADTVQMLNAGVAEAAKNHRALVVGNDAPNFSAGANLMLVLLEAQEGNWDEIDQMVRGFQQAVLGLRYSPVPVIVAPGGLTLGGGAEIALHADRVQGAAETYLGLVEVGVGLIPAGAGTKEMLSRAMAALPNPKSDPLPYVQRAFETVALAKVSRSGPDAVHLGYLRSTDAFTMNRERVIADAKARALERVREGYHRPAPQVAIPVAGSSVKAALELGVHLALRAGRASDHDALIGRTLAHIFAGGDLPHRTTVSEAYLLDLEREAFLSLVGQRKTLERIQHTLKTGKVLRN